MQGYPQKAIDIGFALCELLVPVVVNYLKYLEQRTLIRKVYKYRTVQQSEYIRRAAEIKPEMTNNMTDKMLTGSPGSPGYPDSPFIPGSPCKLHTNGQSSVHITPQEQIQHSSILLSGLATRSTFKSRASFKKFSLGDIIGL